METKLGIWKRFWSSYLEPVDVAAVDERRKLTKAASKRVPDRTERYNDVQQLFATLYEESKQLKRIDLGVLFTSSSQIANQLHRKHDKNTTVRFANSNGMKDR